MPNKRSDKMTDTVPLGLYIHFPWCIRKCPYCDFNSHEVQGEAPQAAYLARLLQDLREDYLSESHSLPESRPFSSVFVGGGTPSLFMPDLLAKLLVEATALSGALGEVTLEANPGAVDAQRFAAYRTAGVTRLSLGFQSMNRQSLNLLGRIHDDRQAVDAYRLARHVGFDNINIDLMHGLPNQRLGDALQDLEEVIALGPEHISWYQLTIEKNTHFYSSPPSLPDEDALQQIWQRGHELLGSAGYAQYEVSAYARDGRQCEHNLNYWRFGDYLGIGAGAHGKRTLSNGQILRRRKTRMPADYMAGSVADDMTSSQIKAIAEPVPEDEITQEFLMNALRLTDGFDAALYEQRTGQAFSQLEAFIAEGSKRGLLAWQASTGQVQATQLGQRFLDSLLLLAS